MSNGGWCWTQNLNKRAMLQEWVNSKSSKFVEHCHYVSLNAASWLAGKHWKPKGEPPISRGPWVPWLTNISALKQHTAAGIRALYRIVQGIQSFTFAIFAMMQPPLSSQASQSEAKLLRMLQQRRAAKSQATTPSNLSTSSRDSLTFSTSKRYRINTSLPRLPHFLGSADIPTGVSAAFLVSFLVHCRSKVEQPTTRAAAMLRENGGVPIATLCGRVPHRDENHPMDPMDPRTGDFNRHPLTGGPIRGPSRFHVAHAWDADFEALVDCLVKDAGAELDRRYNLDIFGEDVECPERSSQRSVTGVADSPIESLQATVAAVQEVVLILDKDALCFSRLWVLTEAMMAVSSNKLRISSTASLGSTEMDIQTWEERVDGIDWSLATSSRKNDERRLRKFAERVWDMNGIGTDRLLAQLKVALRKYIYGQILVKDRYSDTVNC